MKFLKLILAIFFLQITLNLYSQDFEAGLTSGINFAQVDGDLSAGYEKFGYEGGIILTNKFKNDLGFQTEIKYIQKGSRNVHTNQSAYIYYVIRLQYVEVPVILTYPFNNVFSKPKLKNLSFAGGLSFGYLLNAVEDKDGYGFLPANPNFNKYELGYLAGFNYKFNNKINLNVLLGYSILKIRDKPCGIAPWYKFTMCGQYNNTVQISLNYKFVK